MALHRGDRIRSKRELSGGFFSSGHVRKGAEGTVTKVTWSGKYEATFDNGTRLGELTDEDIERKVGWI